jgi:hypothetical protein
MTDQRTTMDQQTTMDQATASDEPTTTEQATAAEPTTKAGDRTTGDRPMGTRELRDAQQTGTPQRPGIQVTGDDAPTGTSPNAPLFDEGAGRQLRERWLMVQTEFVDEPRAAVEKADALVAEVLQQLTATFAREREALEAGWSGSGDGAQRDVSTEDLRQAIQRYRSFFNRLLAL